MPVAGCAASAPTEEELARGVVLAVTLRRRDDGHAGVPVGCHDAAHVRLGLMDSKANITTAYVCDWRNDRIGANAFDMRALDPYTNPEGALARRNLVLDTMIQNVPQEAEALRAARAEPLGIEVRVGDPEALLASGEAFGVLAQYPATDGRVRDLRALVATTHAKGALFIACPATLIDVVGPAASV